MITRIYNYLFPLAYLSALLACAPAAVDASMLKPLGDQKREVPESLLSERIQSAKTPEQDWREEFEYLEKEIGKVREGKFNLERLNREAARESSVYRESDKTPVDIVMRRVKALVAHFEETGQNKEAAKTASKELEDWESRHGNSLALDREQEIRQFLELCKIRRKLSFSNPLLDFDRMVFLTHYTQRQAKGEIHIVDQYLGFNARPGGAPYILENPFSDKPEARKLLDKANVSNGRWEGKPLKDGSFISLELGYDARKMYFAWTQAISTPVTGQEDWSNNYGTHSELMRREPSYHHYFWAPDRVYHIFSLDLEDGTLRQLTDGHFNAFDPCELPNGRVVYISESVGSNQRCGGRWLSAGTLHSMKQDGSDAYPISFHETNEWQPSVNNEGMLVYTRWDYVDRDDCGAHHLWQCYPDGRDPRAPHGNYARERELRPFAELGYRAIPGSRKLVAAAVAHHGIGYGSLITVDPTLPDDGEMSQVKRITPEVHFMESERDPGFPHPLGRTNAGHRGENYGTPWPLSEDFFLCVYARNQEDYGIYLVDSFGNKELIWQDAEVPCLDPIPLRPRPRPTVIPDMTTQSADKRAAGEEPSDMAHVLVLNVYDTERPLPEGVKIKWLRAVNVFSKSTVFANEPNIGMANQSLARGSLGVVPVEDDGSAYFTMPVNVNIYFQLLDENMQAVHSMRSSTYAHSGELLTCVGCHESRSKAPDNIGSTTVMALRRSASELIPEPEGSFPLTFPRLVQPVLDKNCVSCHAKEENAPALDGNTWNMAVNEEGKKEKRNVAHGWSNGFMSLHNWGWGRHGGNGHTWHANKFTYTVPGDVGARASRLVPFLEKGHHNVKLDREDWHRLSLWIDLNTNFYGAYEDTEAQARGEVVMPLMGVAKVNPFVKKQNVEKHKGN